MKRIAATLLSLVVLAVSGPATSAEQKIAGDIVKVDGSSLEVKAADGRDVSLRLADDVRLSARSPADLTKLTQGVFVGTAAAPRADGTLVAREVHVYPESMRGRGEGHRPMDNELPGSTMTNATISRVGGGDGARSTMTNATVANVAGAQGGRTLTLAYKGGEKTVFVPKDTPVVMVEPADRSQLVPGAHVIVFAATQADGSLAATRITVGLKGLVPPL
jgi:hypothetical protein